MCAPIYPKQPSAYELIRSLYLLLYSAPSLGIFTLKSAMPEGHLSHSSTSTQAWP